MADNTPLAGTTALVTGASSGIGEAAARHLAGLGADVALVARRRDRIEALSKQIEADDGRALVVEADVTDREQAEGIGAADRRGARQARHPGQQRRE